MKKIFVLAVVGIIGYYVWNSYYGPNRQLSPAAPMPYIHVYGTTMLFDNLDFITRLETNNVKYILKDVFNDEGANMEFRERAKSTGIEREINLPVVDVNGYFLEQPEYEKIMELYKKY